MIMILFCICREEIDWYGLYKDYIKSHVYYMPFNDKNIKYLSYFDEIEIHSNNDILKTKDNINCLVYGYVKQNTKDIYDLSELTKIIIKYFGPPANQSIFNVLRQNRAKDTLVRNMSTSSHNEIHHLEMGHLYRTIIFNTRLNKNSVKLSIIRANICDYWEKHCSQTSLGFGFAIGAIQLDLKRKISFNCRDDNGNIKKNPLSLSHNMDSFVTDLVGLYYKSIQILTAAHFVFDTNKNCFVYKTHFHFPAQDGSIDLSNIHEGIDDTRQTSRYDSKQEYIQLNQSIEIHAECIDNIFQAWSVFLTIGDENNYKIDLFSDIATTYGTSVWLPVVSCVGCNCPSCSDSPLVLALTTSKKSVNN